MLSFAPHVSSSDRDECQGCFKEDGGIGRDMNLSEERHILDSSSPN